MNKIPWTHSRAGAYMYNNVGNRKLKKRARKEYRRWLKSELPKTVEEIQNDIGWY
jgi:hypothetical protein